MLPEQQNEDLALSDELDGILGPSSEPWSSVGNVDPAALGTGLPNPAPAMPQSPPPGGAASSLVEDGIAQSLGLADELKARAKAIRDKTEADRFASSLLGSAGLLTEDERAQQIIARQSGVDEGVAATEAYRAMRERMSGPMRAFTAPVAVITDLLNDERVASLVREQRELDKARENPNAPMASWGRDKAERFATGLSGIVSGIADGIGRGYALGRYTVGADDKIVDDNVLTALGELVEARAEQMFPGDPVRQEDFAAKAAAGLGSIAGFYGVNGASKIFSKLLRHTDAARERLQWLAVTTAGALVGSSEAGRDVDRSITEGRSVSDLQKGVAYLGGLVLGATESLPILSDIPGLSALTRSQLANRLAQEAVDEGLQEATQTLGQNALSKVIHDPNANLLEGVVESMVIGAMGGAGAGVAGEAKTALLARARGAPPPQAAQPGQAPSKAFSVALDGEPGGAPVPETALAARGLPAYAASTQPVGPQDAAGLPVPTFAEITSYLPVDENGDPDITTYYEVAEATTGKRYWNQLSDSEKALVAQTIAADAGVAEPPASPAAPVPATVPSAQAPPDTPTVAQSAPVAAETGSSGGQPQGGVSLSQALPEAKGGVPATQGRPEQEVVEAYRRAGIPDDVIEAAAALPSLQQQPDLATALDGVEVDVPAEVENENGDLESQTFNLPAVEALSMVDKRLHGIAMLMKCLGI